jgi:hypothetical protein
VAVAAAAALGAQAKEWRWRPRRLVARLTVLIIVGVTFTVVWSASR